VDPISARVRHRDIDNGTPVSEGPIVLREPRRIVGYQASKRRPGGGRRPRRRNRSGRRWPEAQGAHTGEEKGPSRSPPRRDGRWPAGRTGELLAGVFPGWSVHTIGDLAVSAGVGPPMGGEGTWVGGTSKRTYRLSGAEHGASRSRPACRQPRCHHRYGPSLRERAQDRARISGSRPSKTCTLARGNVRNH